MDFDLKCYMGEELYLIISEDKSEQCPFCGEPISYTICDWKIWKTVRIDGITVTERGTFYSLDDGGQISESMIDNKNYFTTRQAAQDECDRRNREGGE